MHWSVFLEAGTRLAELLFVHTCPIWLVLAVSAALMTLIGSRMRRLERDTGITPSPKQVALEFARGKAKALGLTKAWGITGSDRVRAQLYLDFGLIATYVATCAAVALLAAHGLPARTRAEVGLTVTLIWSAAGLLDIVENLLLLQVLPPDDHPGMQRIAYVVVVFKWALVIVGILAVVSELALGAYALVAHL
jgi:hypothetical protein